MLEAIASVINLAWPIIRPQLGEPLESIRFSMPAFLFDCSRKIILISLLHRLDPPLPLEQVAAR